MNPLDLPGPEFLGLYTLLLIVVSVATSAASRWLREVPDDDLKAAPKLDPFTIARLANGRSEAVSTAISHLVAEKVIAIDAAGTGLKVLTPIPTTAHRLEHSVYAMVVAGRPVSYILSADHLVLDQMESQLSDEWLLLPAGRMAPIHLTSLALHGGLLLLGIVKLGAGVSRHRPVGFLLLLLVVTAITAICRSVNFDRKSSRGNRLLDALRAEHDALRATARTHAAILPSRDLALAVGLFGSAILAGSALASVHTVLRPPPGSGGSGCSSGGGCGGGGCGGGGCGGGCGGCGG